MPNNKTECLYQGEGKQNPVNIGGYDIVRPTDDPTDPAYWIYSGVTTVYDAAAHNGQGGDKVFNDLIKISKGASGEGCTYNVALDLQVKPVEFNYYPPHPLDVIFVLDVTSSMMSSGSHKMAQAKRALAQTIKLLWDSNKDTTVTIVPYGRDAIVPMPGGGFSYDYLGTLFAWKRTTGNGHIIGQLLGYRNQSYVNQTVLSDFIAVSKAACNDVELSLYNKYNYYKIQYSDIYNDDGSAKPDDILSGYIAGEYAANPSKYNGNFLQNIANGQPLNEVQLSYSMNDTGYGQNTILENALWAIPYSEDTNTQAGLLAAQKLLQTPGFAHQSDDILRRAVILITDGQANRSINPEYAGSYAVDGSTDAAFLPDIPGDSWKYFMQLKQTYPLLVQEINNRSSTYEELILALERAYDAAAGIKDPARGNALLFVLGIELDAQTPGPYTKQDVIDIMKSIATTPAYMREAYENSAIESIVQELILLVQDVLELASSLKTELHDGINNALFDYVPGTLKISGTRDGLKIKSISAPDITDPTDPDYTVYKKVPLLPDVSDSNFNSGKLHLDLGLLPYAIPSNSSLTTIKLEYNIKAKGSVSGEHLHTNNDAETFIRFSAPDHDLADSSAVVYSNASKDLHFHTPIVSCAPAYTIQKYLGNSPDDITKKRLNAPVKQNVYYRFIVTNYTDEPIVFDKLEDVKFVSNIEDAQVSGDKTVIAEIFTVPAGSSSVFERSMYIDCNSPDEEDIAILYLQGSYIYDGASFVVTEKEKCNVTPDPCRCCCCCRCCCRPKKCCCAKKCLCTKNCEPPRCR